MLYSLDSRCQDILLYLLYLDEYITIQDLSLEKNISKRSVYYDLCKIVVFIMIYVKLMIGCNHMI